MLDSFLTLPVENSPLYPQYLSLRAMILWVLRHVKKATLVNSCDKFETDPGLLNCIVSCIKVAEQVKSLKLFEPEKTTRSHGGELKFDRTR